jgi:non-lysosomal glucosylceramidase
LNSYREHLASPDRKWLDANWPRIKRAMEYSITTWDKNADGVLAGPQWNTLDGALGGNTSWLGTMYLAALAAAEKMALLENDPQAANRYAAIRASGSKLQDQSLFNGEYYIQIPDPEPREDYGTGCEIDQLLGQWWADQLNLGWLYPPENARTALRSLFKYNFRGNMHGLVQVPRKFVADDDPAMQMITWPKGPRPPKCILYGDEAMTGFEYSAAAAMIQAGLVREGLTVARGVWTRYDGRLRQGVTVGGFNGNPFGDDECGKYYARAMSAWSLLLACQGFVYDGPASTIGFRPVWQPEDHTSFYTAAEGWGVFHQDRRGQKQIAQLSVFGKLPIRTLILQVPEKTRPEKVVVSYISDPGRFVPATFAAEGRDVRITLAEPIVLKDNVHLVVDVTLAGP